MKKWILWIIGISLISIGIAVLITFNSGQKMTPIDLDEMQVQVAEEINHNEEYMKKTMDWANQNNTSDMDLDLEFLEPHKHSDVSPERNVFNYFMTGILQNNIEHFTSAFDVTIISNDLFQSSEVDKEAVVLEIMNRISRNNKIVGLSISEKKALLETNSSDYTLQLTYSDGITRQIVVSLNTSEYSHSHSHDGHEHEIYTIDTSAWDIIKQIEGADN